MSQIFKPTANAVARLGIAIGFGVVVGSLVLLDLLTRSPYGTEVNVAREQPVPFSHKHHANMGIDCRYCHTSVEEGAFAGIPPTKTCMNCHSQIFNDSPMLEPVRESWKTGESLQWNRVHDLPQFVYFNHSIHVAKGIGCSTCHGRVDQMPLTRKVNTLYMGWCLDCHRAPEKFVRPKDKIFDMAWQPPPNQREVGLELLKEYKIDTEHYKMLDCYLCHR
ncbi:MAG: cytochrome c family protein [Kiritimatiellae bacterium]|nr:cytochrome c family protein [Kiritimatiellia bacterium]MCO5060767.1 cytochrome c family protein [Kiritimatiellia bacterium]MCO6399873.1 cytochrome c3 family protein [Verrucomicrobiota bacterium]